MIILQSFLQALIDETLLLVKAASDGDFNIRVDVTKHEGEYGRIIEGETPLLTAW
ncbi:MAG: hypothetical protein GXY48_12095 [Methanomicrobiales archaeon]|nr:hypothetical protein [Methanomicrobiales archaeon]